MEDTRDKYLNIRNFGDDGIFLAPVRDEVW